MIVILQTRCRCERQLEVGDTWFDRTDGDTILIPLTTPMSAFRASPDVAMSKCEVRTFKLTGERRCGARIFVEQEPTP